MDILSITFSEIKHFALDSTGAGMAVIDKWFVGLVLLIAILPIFDIHRCDKIQDY